MSWYQISCDTTGTTVILECSLLPVFYLSIYAVTLKYNHF